MQLSVAAATETLSAVSVTRACSATLQMDYCDQMGRLSIPVQLQNRHKIGRSAAECLVFSSVPGIRHPGLRRGLHAVHHSCVVLELM